MSEARLLDEGAQSVFAVREVGRLKNVAGIRGQTCTGLVSEGLKESMTNVDRGLVLLAFVVRLLTGSKRGEGWTNVPTLTVWYYHI